MAEVAKKFGTPRRTVLLEGGGAAAAAAVPLEVTDDPCVVLMSATGLLARVPVSDPDGSDHHAERAVVPPPEGAPRAAQDVIIAAIRATVRGTIGVVTSAGRLVKLNVLEVPGAAAGGGGGVAGRAARPATEFAELSRGETVVGLALRRCAGGRGGAGDR